jgi:diguanylate cyclase
MALLAALRDRLETADEARRTARSEIERGDLLAAARTLIVCARELLIDVDELDASRLRAALDKVAIRDPEESADDDARRLVRAVDRHKGDLLDHADRGRRYLRERESELLHIIRTLSDGLASIGSDGESHVRELDTASARIDRLARLDDVRALRAELGREVVRLREIARDKRDRDRARLSALEREVDVLRGDIDEARRKAATDPLTGASNRAGFDEELARLVTRARTSDAPFTLLLIDVDHFKSINDKHGHLVGDRVLRGLAEVLAAGVRREDLVARYGGEEFAVLLPGAKVKVGMRTAERLRREVEGRRWTTDGSDVVRFTVSVGVGAFRAGDEAGDLVGRADAALYKAKQEGRNRTYGS